MDFEHQAVPTPAGGAKVDWEVERARQMALRQDPVDLPDLLALLQAADPFARRYAIYGLERRVAVAPINASAKAVIPLLDDQDWWVRRAAAECLGRLGDPVAVSPLVAKLGHEDPYLVQAAVRALGRIGDPSCQEPLIEVFGKDETWRKINSVWDQRDMLDVVMKKFFEDRRIVPVLQKLLARRDEKGADGQPVFKPQLFQLMAMALAKFGDHAGEDILIAGLEKDDYTQQESLEYLGKMRSLKAAPGVVKLLASEYYANKALAIAALGDIGGDEAKTALAQVYQGPDSQAVAKAGEIIKQLGETGKMLNDALQPDAKDRDIVPAQLARLDALAAELVALAPKLGPVVGPNMADSDQDIGEVRKEFAALAEAKEPSLTRAKRLADGLERTAAQFKELVGSANDFNLRNAAAQALGRIGGQQPPPVAPPAPAVITAVADGEALAAPGGRRPPQFICLGVDDCASIEGLEGLLEVVEAVRAKGAKACFTMWVSPLAGDFKNRDIVKQALLTQRLFDLGCEIAHHTLHHNPQGKNWSAWPREIQVQEIDGVVQWYREHIEGFTRPFAHKGGGGGSGKPVDPEFTRALLDRQQFLYRLSWRGSTPVDQKWPLGQAKFYQLDGGVLDGNAPPVHAEITRPVRGDYPGNFNYEVADGVRMMKANFDFRYRHPRRPVFAIGGYHDWGFKSGRFTHRHEKEILKQFLLEVLVENRDQYPDTHCVTFRQLIEYVYTDGDLAQTLAIGNGQDTRNPNAPKIWGEYWK